MSASALGLGRTLGGGRARRIRVGKLVSGVEAGGELAQTVKVRGCRFTPTPVCSTFELIAVDETTWESAKSEEEIGGAGEGEGGGGWVRGGEGGRGGGEGGRARMGGCRGCRLLNVVVCSHGSRTSRVPPEHE
jgi:hypothetical protein